MTLRPCTAHLPAGICGQLPAITESERSGIQILRVECKCGAHGATLMYSKPQDRARMLQAAADGWNLG